MAFSWVVLVAALWALSAEMVEDSLVDLIYGHIFGWRTLIRAFFCASVVLASLSALVIFTVPFFLRVYLGMIQKGAALLLTLIGVIWLVSSIFGKGNGIDEARGARDNDNRLGKRRGFILALQLVSIEELEILLIMIPLFLTSHAIEATIAASVGILLSLSTAVLFRKWFSKLVEGKLRLLKIASGLFLIVLGMVLLAA